MSSNIRKIVTDAAGSIPAGYSTKVDAVVEALETAAAGIAEALVEKGVALGARKSDLDALMVEVGLVSEPEEEPAAAEDSGSGTDVSAILRRLDALEAAARRAGVTV